MWKRELRRSAGKILAAVLVAAIVTPLFPHVAGAHQTAQAGCTIAPAFLALRDALQEVVGDCLEDEQLNVESGLVEQRTTGGLLMLRVSDGLTGFTDGTTLWLLGPEGVVSRLRDGAPFPWEAEVMPGSGAPAGQTMAADLSPEQLYAALLTSPFAASLLPAGFSVREIRPSSSPPAPAVGTVIINFAGPSGTAGATINYTVYADETDAQSSTRREAPGSYTPADFTYPVSCATNRPELYVDGRRMDLEITQCTILVGNVGLFSQSVGPPGSTARDATALARAAIVHLQKVRESARS